MTGPHLHEPERLEQLAATHRFRLGRPGSVSFSTPDELLYLRSGPRSFVRDLYALDLGTGVETRILTASELLGGADERLTAEERARRERLRQSERGLSSFTLLDDDHTLLIPLSGRLHLFRRDTREVRVLDAVPGAPIDPRPLPDGASLLAVHDGDLWLHTLSGGARRLTRRASEHETFGLPEFVAEEEMGRHRGFWISPDGRRVAVQRTRTERVERLYTLDPMRPEAPPNAAPYPRAGRENAEVDLAILDLATGAMTWVDWDRGAWAYLATVRWEQGGPLTLVLQDRRQQTVAVCVVDEATGAVRELFRETDDAWVNLDQDYPRWLPDGRGFLWATERGGAWQVELRDPRGVSLGAVTPPELGYQGLLGIDARRQELWVRASPDPGEAHVYRVPLSTPPLPVSALPRLTRERGVHTAMPGPRGERLVLTSQTAEGAYQVRVVDRRGEPLVSVPVTDERPRVMPRPVFARVGSDPGLDTLVLRPSDFDPALRYPVVVSVYGGPHVRMVNASAADYVLQQWIADQGFVVVVADGRGTPQRGRDFERAIRGSFVDVPLADQVTALQALAAKHPEFDLSRVGIYGWSFGGYLSAMAALRRPDVFHAAVAGAPVTDWLDYDTHYSERYLGLPAEVPEAYAASGCLSAAETLRVPLLLIHGTSDDNVYYAHSQKLSDALFRAGREHDFVPLANFTHMVADPVVTVRLYGRIVRWLIERLGRPRAS